MSRAQRAGFRPRPTDLVIATTNPAKAERLRWVFDGLGLRLHDMPTEHGPAPHETGRSFRENAELKACFWSDRLGGLATASDGGIAIPALGPNWDAIRTARAAGPSADDVARARHLLGLARGLSGDQRRVYWSEGLALARDGRPVASWQAQGTEAFLVEEFDPNDLRPGFWAASLCFIPSLGTTLASVPEQHLPRADPTWSRLRRQVRAFFESGQGDTDRGG
jgi:inosine/xanthosine triphosphate pyrophosphatase family protein